MRQLTFLTLSTTDWDAPQFGSRQAIARCLARRGHRVLFVEVPRALHSAISDPAGTARSLPRLGRCRTIAERLVAYTPRPLLPVYYHPWTSPLNQRLLRRDLRRVLTNLGWQPDVLWTYWPNSAALCGSFGESITVYHCIDDFTAVSYPLVRPGVIAAMESELCRRVDLVLASTEALTSARRNLNQRTFHLPTGVDLESFDPDRVRTADAEVTSLGAPRIGFVGTLDDRVDTELVAECARQIPEATFIFVGAVKRHRFSVAPLAALANVRLLPPRPHEEIPAVLAAFDAAIIPYRRTPFTENLAPAKLYEYLAMGTPTVSTDLPFARAERDHLRIGTDAGAVVAALREIVAHPPAADVRRQWRAAAVAKSWERLVDRVEDLLGAQPVSRRRISVLQVVASSRGGGATHVRDVATGLDSDRFVVEVAMADDGGHVGRADFERAALRFDPLPLASGARPGLLPDLRRLLARFDVVHAHGARAAFWVRLAGLTLGTRRPRIVYSIHGFTLPFDPPLRRLALRATESALSSVTDRYVAVCQAERNAVVAAGLCSGESIDVVRNGVEPLRYGTTPDRMSARGRLGIAPAQTLVTTICRLGRPRDFETLLTGFGDAASADPHAHLLIVGDGPRKREIEEQVGRLHLSGRVTLAGMHDDVEAVLQASDLFVLTSTGGDGLPLAILEAMAAALPVVATACDGIPEAVMHEQTGLLVDRGDAPALAAALQLLLREPEMRRQLGEAGRALVVREFDVRHTVARLAMIYEQLVPRA